MLFLLDAAVQLLLNTHTIAIFKQHHCDRNQPWQLNSVAKPSSPKYCIATQRGPFSAQCRCVTPINAHGKYMFALREDYKPNSALRGNAYPSSMHIGLLDGVQSMCFCCARDGVAGQGCTCSGEHNSAAALQPVGKDFFPHFSSENLNTQAGYLH